MKIIPKTFSEWHVTKNSKTKWCHRELESSLCMAVKRGSFDIYKSLVATGVEPPDILLEEEKYLVSVDIVRDLLRVGYL